MSSSCNKNAKPPTATKSPGYDVVKEKLGKMGGGWKDVNPDLYIVKNRIKEQLFGEEYHDRYGEELTVKVYMSNVQKNQTWGRIAHAFTGNLPFGVSHAGLQVGNKTVNWYDNSLVTIGEFGASTGFILFSPNENLRVKLSKDLMDQLAEFIIKWNVNETYSQAQSNCQVFVRAFLNVIGLSMPSGPLGKLIKNIRQGNTKRRFETKNCGVLEFETHDELDRLEHDLSDPNLPPDQRLTAEEKKILKLYHRGFQLQERGQEPRPQRQFICPAGEDPTGLPSSNVKREEETLE